MEPKDLKNSEELKSTQSTDKKDIEKDVDPKREELIRDNADNRDQEDKTEDESDDSVFIDNDDSEKPEPEIPGVAGDDPEMNETEIVEENDEQEVTESGNSDPDVDSVGDAGSEESESSSSSSEEERSEDTESADTISDTESSKGDEAEESEPGSGGAEAEITKDAEPDAEGSEEKLSDEGKEAVSEADKKTPKTEEAVGSKKMEADSDKSTGEKKEESKHVKVSKTDKPAFVKVTIPTKHKKVQAEPEHEDFTDYSEYTQVELVNALRDLLENNSRDVKREVEAIKAAFYKKLKEDIELHKKEFIANGGDEDEFVPEDNPYENDIKELLKLYRQQRIEYSRQLEQDKEVNLQLKYEVIEEIKGLIHKEESINKTFQEFRDLQKRWREIGLVPQTKVKDLWDTYNFHVENFYDYIKINQELRDLDLKKNLEIKIRLCEQAEELLLETNVIRAFNALQKLHDRWREVGPVPREHKEDIWERFKIATSKINKKHQDYFEDRKAEQRKNLEAKKALCEQVEEIGEMEFTNHKELNDKSKEVINLQKVWRTIGFAPRKDNNKIYSRFRAACDNFFDKKREFYAQNKELQQNNLQMKIDLCVQAEALKDSTDWRKATNDLINIQRQWKEIGPVPRKQSDALWKRFRAACDYFFDKKSDHFSNIDAEQIENLNNKEKLIEEVENFKPSADVDENLNRMKEFQRRWTEIGHVPIKKKDIIQRRFREAINKLFDDLNVDESERNLLKFKTKMATFSESSYGQDKMRMEREKYMNKLKQLETDLVLLDNNIGFFAKSKKTESLIKDVKRKIEQTKDKIEFLKEKIRVIDEMDQSED
jgi:hypothetical protein